MSDPAARLRLGLDAAWRRWLSDHGGVGIREMIAIAAVGIVIVAAVVAVLEVAGFLHHNTNHGVRRVMRDP